MAVAAVGALCALDRTPALAQGSSCTTQSDCAVVSATCLDGACRLAMPEALIASLPLTEITLVEPATRAMVAASQPDIRFTYPSGAARVAVAITSQPPRYDAGGSLLNTEDVVWYWTSSFEGLVTGIVPYGKGKLLDPKSMACVDRTPAALKPGVYYWAALGWGSDGQLSHQSELRAFSVGVEHLTGTFCDDVDDCGRAGYATCTTPNHYCVLRCASDRDCFGGTACDLSTVGTVEGVDFGVCRAPGLSCACGSNERCDADGTAALRFCYRPQNNAQMSAGCDCGGSSSPGINPCYAAMMGIVALGRRRRRR